MKVFLVSRGTEKEIGVSFCEWSRNFQGTFAIHVTYPRIDFFKFEALYFTIIQYLIFNGPFSNQLILNMISSAGQWAVVVHFFFSIDIKKC